LQSLAAKIGIDGIALCSNEEDFTLDNELNFGLVRQPTGPWYEQLKEQQLTDLFNEHIPSRPTISHVIELFQEPLNNRKRKQMSSLSMPTEKSSDLYNNFS
jgi:hypothetical protein